MSKNQLAVKEFFNREDVTSKFKTLLGNKAAGFIASVLQVTQSNDYLKEADPKTVFNAAATAAILDIPINNNLGFAYIVPYKGQAQFQMGYKGFIQLAQRSGQFLTISASPIFEGQILESNPLTGYKFDFTVTSKGNAIGYAAYFKLLNGFEKTIYMTVEELKKHGKSYSQTFKSDKGLWKDNFDAMALKTVIKLLLSKFAPLSIEMTRAVISDQAVVNDFETQEVTYVDNGEVVEVTAEDVAFLYDMKKDALSESERTDIERILANGEEASFKKAVNKLKAL
jgi:recombination protein RecT